MMAQKTIRLWHIIILYVFFNIHLFSQPNNTPQDKPTQLHKKHFIKKKTKRRRKLTKRTVKHPKPKKVRLKTQTVHSPKKAIPGTPKASPNTSHASHKASHGIARQVPINKPKVARDDSSTELGTNGPSHVTCQEACPESCQKVEPYEKHLEHLSTVRKQIIEKAKTFLHHPYVGGSKIKKAKKTKQGHHIDCSELIQLAYRAHHLEIPRNSHMQFLRSNKIKSDIAQHLKPADLIFSAPLKNPKRITHVMMYIGNDHLIESTGAHGKVHIKTVHRRVGTKLSKLSYGKRIGKFIYYFGTFFRKRKESPHLMNLANNDDFFQMLDENNVQAF
jgi:cell wall-associated NlpC family hydrolase